MNIKTEDCLYNSRLIDTYLKLLKAKYPQVDIEEVLRSARLQSYEVSDQGVWFTQSQINRFHVAIRQATGNENIALEAGRFVASPETLGTIRQMALGTFRQFALGMISPGKAFKLVSKISKNLTRSADYQSRVISANSVEVIVRLRPGVTEEPFQCQNRIGIFESLISMFSFKAPTIEHTECLFKGGTECRYLITWQPNIATRIRKVRDVFVIAALVGNVGIAVIRPELLSNWLVASLTIIWGLNWWFSSKRLQLIGGTFDQLKESSQQLTDQIKVNSRNIDLTREIGEVITSQSNIDDVISTVVHILEKSLDYDRGLILLANANTQRLEIRGAFGYTPKHLKLLEQTSFRLDNPESEGPFIVSYRKKKPILVNDAEAISEKVSEKSRAFIRAIGTKSFLSVPIILNNQSIGILAVDNYQCKQPLVNSDLNLLMGIAPTIGISFRNAALKEARENQFAATLRVLAHSIDARDFLTAGHSEQVSEYAVGIAMKLDMSYEYCQMIRAASLLHDYGKIGIPDTVLKKNGPLTATERSLIETHPEKSRDILSQVPFEGLYREIPLIALHHHERWDGKGYPSGLAGDMIPYGARIVAVADFFEAITAKRHYRDPMSVDAALILLRASSGTHFDPQIVDAFLSYRDDPQKELDDLSSFPLIDYRMKKFQSREPRCQFQSGVRVEVDGMSINAETVDISTNGIFLRLDKQLTRQINCFSKVRLELTLDNSKNIELEGEVRWINKGSIATSQQHPAGVGISFKNINDHSRMLLLKVIKSLHRSGRAFSLPTGLTGMES